MADKKVFQSSSITPSCCVKFDVNYFWKNVTDNVKKQCSNLLFERNVYLDDERECVLVIGVMPHNKFEIGARIERRFSKNVVHLDKDKLFDLIECVDERFCENAVYPQACRSVRIQLYDAKCYKIRIGDDQCIKLCLATLLTLRQKHKLIKMQVAMLEKNDYERQMHKLLLHFCYDGDEQTVVKAMQAPAYMQKPQFIDTMCALDCSCVDKSFVVEMANGCSDWFLACVPLFIKTLLMSAV